MESGGGGGESGRSGEQVEGRKSHLTGGVKGSMQTGVGSGRGSTGRLYAGVQGYSHLQKSLHLPMPLVQTTAHDWSERHMNTNSSGQAKVSFVL